MGFGTLFIGYFIAFLMSFHKYGFACQIIGYYIMFVALQKLSEYKYSLARAVLPLLIMTLCGVYDAGALVSSTFFSIGFPGVLTTVVDILQIAGSFVFQIYLLRGISELASDTELPKISKTAKWNLVVVTSYILLTITFSLISIAAVLFSNQETGLLYSAANILAPITVLSSILYPIPVLFLIFSCYAQICTPEDIDMPPRNSKNKK